MDRTRPKYNDGTVNSIYPPSLDRIVLKWRWQLCLLLYLVAAVLRLYELKNSPVFSDETLWYSRSQKVIEKIASDPPNATTHLPHPGIGAVIPMAIGEFLSVKLNKLQGHARGDINYISAFDGGRAAIAVSSALIGPAIFIGCLHWLNPAEALVAAALTMIEPQHLGASRILHIDSMLTLYIWIALFLYLHAVEKGKPKWKIAAGIVWGLALSIKPNAAFIIPVLLIYRLARYFITLKNPYGERGILNWSDLGVIVLGHLDFVLLYTRLWYHHSEYAERMHLRCPIATDIFNLGMSLRANFLLTGCVLLTLLGMAYIFHQRSKIKQIYRHLFILVLTLASALCLLTSFPQVFEGIARYWGWAAGLSTIENTAFGSNHKLTLEEWAYLKYIVTSLPDVILLLLPFAVTFLIARWRVISPQSRSFLILLLVLTPIWLTILSVSEKRSIRYLLPSIPSLFILAIFGARYLSILISERLQHSFVKRYAYCIVLCMMVTSVSILLPTNYPFYSLYRNFISGGFRAGIDAERGDVFSSYAIPDVIAPIANEIRRPDHVIYVCIKGNASVWDSVVKRIFPALKNHIVFGDLAFKQCHFAIDKPRADHAQTFIDRYPDLVSRVKYSYQHQGVNLVKLIDLRGYTSTPH